MSLPAQEYPDRIGLVSDGPPPFTPYIAPETKLRESDLLALIPFAVLVTVLYLTGREKLLTPKPTTTI